MRKFKHNLHNTDFQSAVENCTKMDSTIPFDSYLTYSQTGQDLFVIAATSGKKGLTFLELGCNQPKYGNNTYVLEKFFNFSGVSIDISYDEHQQFNEHLDITERSWPLCRPTTIWYKTDALTFDYSTLSNYYDYLQVDLDPANISLEALKLVCSTKKFAVITFEHDAWDLNSNALQIREQSRKFLTDEGYVLIAGNIGFTYDSRVKHKSYEDWWVNPKFVDESVIKAYKLDNDETKTWRQVLFN